MEAIAYIKYLRISPKKMKPFGKEIVGLPPQEAIDKLLIFANKSAKILAKVVKSAFANATNNLKLDPSQLRVKSVETLKGPFFKRWQPVSRGMAHQIKKRTAHIKVVIAEKSDNLKKEKK